MLDAVNLVGKHARAANREIQQATRFEALVTNNFGFQSQLRLSSQQAVLRIDFIQVAGVMRCLPVCVFSGWQFQTLGQLERPMVMTRVGDFQWWFVGWYGLESTSPDDCQQDEIG